METAVQERVDSHTPSHSNGPTENPHDVTDPEQEGAKVCQYFLSSRCHFGDRCRLSHSAPMSDVPGAVRAGETDRDDTENERKNKKNKKNNRNDKKKNKQASESDEKESTKKLRMRTADDVISRILWDDSVDPADFVVGHLDRFLGVLERPFSDFSWDTPISDCDYSEELALPRHRIQYFSYRGQRVWDRDSRMDRVFGSTGQTVVPPFATEDQAQENSATDGEQQVQGNRLEEPPSNQQEVATERNDKKYDGDRQEALTAEQEAAVADTGSTSAGQQEALGSNSNVKRSGEDPGLARLTEELSLSPRDGQIEGGQEEEWRDGWEGEEEKEHLAWEGSFSSSPEKQSVIQVSPKDQRGFRPPRKPTHFVCLRVDSPAGLQAFQRVQKKVLAQFPQSEPHWVTPESLHITLCLLVLQGPSEVSAAAQLLRTTVQNLRKPPVCLSFPPKLKHFGGKVLYVAPQPLPDIQALNAPLQEAFRGQGWLHRHSRSPIYHLTLAKAEGSDRVFEGVGVVKLGKDVNFGKLEANKLYLCVNSTPCTESGFYQTACAVQIPEL
ncbi:leukocyte receptor cluster member 9 [Chanos chanos]|uniref:Leukocyte receptor cluster member 9 n=1 Tax=Chanos chanos TaxID=29144 RepID=A0A6J2W883_CHACN|nr:leukocyte receptor cluster member 9 [Chanos chanos]XP_030640470.1 leukocyte receptor cluster member 9 [Chanos chanos]